MMLSLLMRENHPKLQYIDDVDIIREVYQHNELNLEDLM